MKAFEGAKIGGINVKNRIFRSATHENMAKSGRVSPAMTTMYKNLSEGEIGLIITGYMNFSESDNPFPQTMSIGNDDVIPELKALTDMVHENCTRIVAQLSHLGSQLTYAPSGPVFAPSDAIDPINGIQPEPFSVDQIQKLVKEFGEAALRAKKAGFDGVQIHGAHGYLLSKFLSPVYNKRTDDYGGSPLKNARIIVDILKEIKTQCGKDYPVWVKLNCSDFGRNGEGLTFDDFLIAVKEIADNGIDAIEVSGGTMTGEHSPCRSKKHENYHLNYAKKLTKTVDTPVILVGGFRNIETIESVLSETALEAVSMCRPLIREPGLVKRWMGGERKIAACVACNGCFNPNGTRCYFELEGEEKANQKEIMKIINSMSGNS
jgi:2,4-dienoyl-CoA reductase-like NADH-dependent reductase (Old Yellow Enzyme family)